MPEHFQEKRTQVLASPAFGAVRKCDKQGLEQIHVSMKDGFALVSWQEFALRASALLRAVLRFTSAFANPMDEAPGFRLQAVLCLRDVAGISVGF